MSPLRLSLTIPGAVSLGAYEGGALAALIVAAQALGEDTLVIDSIAAASAGSITGLLAARSLLGGVDPVKLLAAAWVENVSFGSMKTTSTDSPLSSEALTAMATRLLGPDGMPSGPRPTWQEEPVWLSMALTSLAGLTYDLPDLSHNTVIRASTFLDWYTVGLRNTATPQDYLVYADAAIASGSNAVGFPAKRLNRLGDKEQYDDAGLQGFPEDGQFWYTDGGTVDNEPLGRTIDLATNITSDDERLYLLIHPDPSFPSGSPSNLWGGDAPLPPWVRTGTHAFSISRSQSIYEDLKRLEKTNSHLEWIETIAPAVASGVDQFISDSRCSDTDATLLRSSLTSSIGDALEGVRQRQSAVSAMANRIMAEREQDQSEDYAALLDSLLHAASGLEGRAQVRVEVVSPTIDPSITVPPSEQLAGAFFFHFGGFFDIKLRQSDFALGYRNMKYWLENRLSEYLPKSDLSTALRAVNEEYDRLGWDGIRAGGAQLSSLSLREKAGLGRLALHTGRVIAHDLIREPSHPHGHAG